jgi:hypothetical protein
MKEHFVPDTVQWLTAEMADNRRKDSLQAKVYCQQKIYSSLTSKGPLERHWGSHALLSKLAEAPEHLEPQATAAAAAA